MKIAALISGFIFCAVPICALAQGATSNVIFIHPDGTGLGHWNAARYLIKGPDGMLNWDRMEHLAAYRPHQKNWLSTTSHAGATVHAYGRKVHHDSYGMDRDQPLTALSGKEATIMEEAMENGYRCGIINSGHIGEPGTGVFLASSERRSDIQKIALQIIESGVDLIFCGGEIYLLPEGVVGQHGKPGVRTDGRNLLAEARARGYTVIFTRDELLELDPETKKVIGIFAAVDTYNDEKESVLKEAGLETYDAEAPTFDEMLAIALKVFSSNPASRFFIVAEEEGTDNFSNKTNAKGMFDAIERADKAIGVAMEFIDEYSEWPTLLLVGSDSDAGHPTVWVPKRFDETYLLPTTSGSGGQLDGPDGTGGRPFITQPDAFGNQYPFGIAWAASKDFPGSGVAKTHGFHSDMLGSTADNTDLYRIMYRAIMGQSPESAARQPEAD